MPIFDEKRFKNASAFLFVKYASVGVLNTAIHWVCFFAFITLGLGQGVANLMAFAVAVTVSFFLNAKVTFNAKTSLLRYVLYTMLLGTLAYGIGIFADMAAISPLLTLIFFSGFSLVAGFVISRHVIFRNPK